MSCAEDLRHNPRRPLESDLQPKLPTNRQHSRVSGLILRVAENVHGSSTSRKRCAPISFKRHWPKWFLWATWQCIFSRPSRSRVAFSAPVRKFPQAVSAHMGRSISKFDMHEHALISYLAVDDPGHYSNGFSWYNRTFGFAQTPRFSFLAFWKPNGIHSLIIHCSTH